jgi:hypothetical protein
LRIGIRELGAPGRGLRIGELTLELRDPFLGILRRHRQTFSHIAATTLWMVHADGLQGSDRHRYGQRPDR